MIARYVLYTVTWLIAAIAGMFGGYNLARYCGIGESIWGNSVDGYCGDFAYKANQGQAWYRKYWACWWWSCIRNPANNLLRRTLNAEGIIKTIEVKGSLTIITFEDRRRFFFFYNEGGKYIVKFGHRFWKQEIKIGEFYSASFVFNP